MSTVATSPVWTADLLKAALSAVLPLNASRTGPDPRAVAAATVVRTPDGVGTPVSPRTVRRWLQADPANPMAPARIPKRRLEAFLAVARPSAALLAREAAAAAAAQESLVLVEKPADRGVLPSWRKQGWLEPWILEIVDIPEWGLRRAKLERVDADSALPPERTPTRGRHRRRSAVVAYATFPNRFAAEIAKSEVLQFVKDWRIVVPRERRVEGRTQTWLASAPLPDLTHLGDKYRR